MTAEGPATAPETTAPRSTAPEMRAGPATGPARADGPLAGPTRLLGPVMGPARAAPGPQTDGAAEAVARTAKRRVATKACMVIEGLFREETW